MMNGARLDTFEIAPISNGNGSLSRIEKVLSSPPFISAISPARVWPNESRAIQRVSDVVQSMPRTG